MLLQVKSLMANPGDTMMVGHGGGMLSPYQMVCTAAVCWMLTPVGDNVSCAPPAQLPSPSSVIVAIPGGRRQTRHLNTPALLFEGPELELSLEQTAAIRAMNSRLPLMVASSAFACRTAANQATRSRWMCLKRKSRYESHQGTGGRNSLPYQSRRRNW